MTISYRKRDARNFHTIDEILRSLILARSLPKGRNVPTGRTGNREVNGLKMKKHEIQKLGFNTALVMLQFISYSNPL